MVSDERRTEVSLVRGAHFGVNPATMSPMVRSPGSRAGWVRLARASFLRGGALHACEPGFAGTWNWLRLHPARPVVSCLHHAGVTGFGAMKSLRQWWDQHRTRERRFIEERSITAERDCTRFDARGQRRGPTQAHRARLRQGGGQAGGRTSARTRQPQGITLSPAHRGRVEVDQRTKRWSSPRLLAGPQARLRTR